MKNQRLQKWYDDVCLKHLVHDYAANKADKLNNRIGFTAVIAGIIAGIEIIDITTTEAVLQAEDPKFWIAIVLASFAIIAAISNAAVRFFGYESKRQKNKSSASAYLTVKYHLESLLWDEMAIVTPDIISEIQQQLSDISTKAPLVNESIIKKIKERIRKETINEIPNYLYYEIKLVERWKVNNLEKWTIEKGGLEEIGAEKTRSYDCKLLKLCEYEKSGKIFIENKHTMTRGKDKIESTMVGEGILNTNTAFITYSVSDNDFSTFGSMVLNFTNKVMAKGLWMTANVKDANLLIGTIELNIIKNKAVLSS